LGTDRSCRRRRRDAIEELEGIESELMVASADGEVDIHGDVSAVCRRIRDRLRSVREGLRGTAADGS